MGSPELLAGEAFGFSQEGVAQAAVLGAFAGAFLEGKLGAIDVELTDDGIGGEETISITLTLTLTLSHQGRGNYPVGERI
jgi:hypothetical protein